MNTLFNSRFSARALGATAMIVIAGLMTGLSGPASAADTSMPQAHSDGLVATLDDAAITTKVKAKFMQEKALRKSSISVMTTNGVVTLSGKAASSDAKSLAEKDARMIEGVKSVDNNLTTPSSNKLEAKTKQVATKTRRVVSDSWITTKVKSEILADSVSKGFDVSVKTYHGVVKLTGTLANHDAIDHVKDIAEKVEGVKSVDTSGLMTADHS
ncbi:MAG: BON domain-containing protein [Steroidobacter sp.]